MPAYCEWDFQGGQLAKTPAKMSARLKKYLLNLPPYIFIG